jgi:hypothetical protein
MKPVDVDKVLAELKKASVDYLPHASRRRSGMTVEFLLLCP